MAAEAEAPVADAPEPEPEPEPKWRRRGRRALETWESRLIWSRYNFDEKQLTYAPTPTPPGIPTWFWLAVALTRKVMSYICSFVHPLWAPRRKMLKSCLEPGRNK